MKQLLFAVGVMALSLPQAALARWTEARSRHFVIYSEQTPDQLRAFADKLERFDQTVRHLRGMNDPELTDSGKLTIFALPDQPSVARMIGRSGIAGFYIGRASGAAAFVHRETENGDREQLTAQGVLFHEYLHHLMLSEIEAPLPAWLVEGAAEFYGTARIQKDGSVQVGAAPGHRAYGLFMLDGLSLEQMLGTRSKPLAPDQVDLLYGRGWLLTHYLTFEPSRKGQLAAYIKGISSGRDALASAKAAFGDLRKLDRDLRRYMEQRRLTAITVSPEALVAGPIQMRPLGEGEAAVMPIRMRSARGVDLKTGPRNAELARRAAATYPDDPVVQSTLAEAEFDVKNYAAALAAAERALARKPDQRQALIFKARAMMELAASDPSRGNWKEIRAVIGQANRLDPDDAQPLMLFYETFVRQGAAPTANALDGLTYAQQLAPQDTSLRLLTVRALLAADKLDQAKQLFGPVVNNPHRGKWSDKWVAIQAAMDSGDAASALKQMLDQDRQYQSSKDKDKDE